MNSEIKNFALIIGAAKCGTTSLFNYLAEHPEISACSNKEYGFFSDAKEYSKGLDFYRGLWDYWNPNVHKIALQAPTAHTRIGHPNIVNSAENIVKTKAKTNSNFKFIYIMRNPIDRIESHYTHLHILGYKGFKDTKIPLCQGIINSELIDSELIDPSKYAMQIEEYYKRFNSDDILLLNFDDLKNNKYNLLKKVCDFLNIDPNYQFQMLDIIHNANNHRSIINIPGWRLMRKNKLVSAIMSATVKQVPNEVRQTFHTLFGNKPNIQGNIKLSKAQREYVLNQLSSDLQKLNRDYGFDVSSWGIKT